MDKGRWTDGAVVAVVCFVTVASFVLAVSYFFFAMLVSFGYRGDTPPAMRDAQFLLMLTSLAYLVAAGSLVYDRTFRTPTQFVVMGGVLVVAAILATWAQSRLRQLPDESGLSPWFLSLGIACALLALAAAWLRYRPSAILAVAIIVAIAVACTAIVGVLSGRSDASREAAREAAQEASEEVCPHVSSVHVGWIEEGLTVPDGRLRAARLQRSAAGDPAWYVLAEVEGEGVEGDGDVGVWRVEAPGATTPVQFAERADRHRVYAANALASGVGRWVAEPLSAEVAGSLDACREEVLREAAGW
jgi:hypothetical protein